MWQPVALYLFWGPFVIWSVVVSILFLKGAPARVSINVLSLGGAILGLAAVTAGWDFDTHTGLGNSPVGLWYILIASWLSLLSPLAGLGGIIGIFADLNSAHLYGYDITGDGFTIAIVATLVVIVGIVLPVSVGGPMAQTKKTLTRRLLTVRFEGLKQTKKLWI